MAKKTKKLNRFTLLWYTTIVRLRAIRLILTYKQFGAVAVPSHVKMKDGEQVSPEEYRRRAATKQANNLSGYFVFLVGSDPQQVKKAITVLTNTYHEMVHKSKHHQGLSVSKDGKLKKS